MLSLFHFDSGELKSLPVPPEVALICSGWKGSLGRFFLLNRFVSKMAGFVFCSKAISKFLYAFGIARAINEKLSETYHKYNYDNLNAAFIHQYERTLYPSNSAMGTGKEDFLSSPADSYLSIRNIIGNTVEFLPGVFLDIPKMIGTNDEELYHQGKLFVFTLKPHHGHTLDFPAASGILSGPKEYNAKRLFVGSTDLEFIRHSQAHKKAVLDENHRVVTILEAVGFREKYVFVEIGANVVNSIEQDFSPGLTVYPRGSRKSHFNFGSTVAMVLPKSFLEKVNIISEIQENSTGVTSCEVKRGTALLYSREISSGEFQVADGVWMKVCNAGEKIRRKLSGARPQ